MTTTEFGIDRRSFLGWGAGTAMTLAAGDAVIESKDSGPRIRRLELHTTASLAAMKEFYHGDLGFHLIEDQPRRLTLAGGATRITFLRAEPDVGRPFYHFAFNIPENKIRAAHAWQMERCPLLPITARLRDPDYPLEVVDYSHWNAHSIFFFDPAGNVVEYIARHDLKNGAPGAFTSRDILYASEIAWIVDDVEAAATTIQRSTKLPQYRGGDDNFRAIGDERGLLLVMKRGRVISFDAPKRKAVSVYPTRAVIKGLGPGLKFPNFPYHLQVEP